MWNSSAAAHGTEGSASWNVNAQEFVPGGPAGDGGGERARGGHGALGMRAPSPELTHPFPMPMPPYASPKGWHPLMMMPPWGGGGGKGMISPEAIQAMMMMKGKGKGMLPGANMGAGDGNDISQKRPDPKGFCAIWNLRRRHYNESKLKYELSEVGFEPEHLQLLNEALGAFVLVFQEEFSAAAAAIALNGLEPSKNILQDNGDKVRVVQWKTSGKENWSDSELPEAVRDSMAQAMLKLKHGRAMA